jgi:hypothetical protein
MATAGTLESVSYRPYKQTFAVHGRADRVRCGDRAHATLLWVPLHVRVAATGARLDVFRRRYGQDVYAYPDGGKYAVSSQAAKIARCP